MMPRFPKLICVYASPLVRGRGVLRMGPLSLPCALGRSGLRHAKKEGDGATPRASLRPLQGFFRQDRLIRPPAVLKLRPIKPNDGWCDDVRHRLYNRPVTLPFCARHEEMQREDEIYDIVIDLSWNRGPIRKGRGSAIFLHLARPGYEPTQGCIAVSKRDMRLLLQQVGPHTKFRTDL